MAKIKKYKVIKTFPNGPCIGTIIKEIGWGNTVDWIKNNPREAEEYFVEVIEPLFTTEDGVDIYEGDDYWLIRNNFTLWQELPIHCDNYGNPKPLKAFSTRKKAEQFIDENKPKYSKKEIKDALKDNTAVKPIHNTNYTVNVLAIEEFKIQLNL